MRKIILATASVISLAGTAALLPGRAEAAPTLNGLQGLLLESDIENVQYRYGGHRYCWYLLGWQGPGWYWCGYSKRRGFGWGGAYGWQGWSAPGYRPRTHVRPALAPRVAPVERGQAVTPGRRDHGGVAPGGMAPRGGGGPRGAAPGGIAPGRVAPVGGGPRGGGQAGGGRPASGGAPPSGGGHGGVAPGGGEAGGARGGGGGAGPGGGGGGGHGNGAGGEH